MRSNLTIVTAARARALVRRFALGTTALFVSFFVMLSCVGEPTAPQKETAKFARGLSFSPVFPQGLSLFGAADQFTFDRVHVVLRHSNGTVALDTTVSFPASVSQVSISLDVRLLPGTPPAGEMLTLEVRYLNSANETIFRGAAPVLAVPTVPGQTAPPPVSVPEVNLVYTGPGSTATAVRISPRTLSVPTGGAFAFTAVATDATGTVVPNTPVAWLSLDPARATLAAPIAGAGVALSQRGTARIVAQLVGGQKDTVTLTIVPVPTVIAAVSGSGQTGIVGKAVTPPLAQPLVVRVTAADGVGVPGASVNFAAANGGSVSPANATTDANGLAQTAWTLGSAAGTQTATASAAGLTGSPVSFSATAQAAVPTKLAFTTAPAASPAIASGAPLALVVAALDAAGDLVTSFTGPVALTLSSGPTGSALAGTTTVNAVAGVATFASVSIALPATGYVISASATGLTGASTPAFDVITGTASAMYVLSGAGQTAAASTALAPITVLLTDANGNAKTNTVVLFAVTSGGGSVAPASVATNAQGRAIASWTLGATAGAQTMSASSDGVPTLSVSATASSTSANWVFAASPAASVAGAPLAPTVVAELRGAGNTLVTTYNGAATIALASNPTNATLAGTTSVTAVNGVATFPGLSLQKAGQGYTLIVSATNTGSATTSAFDVTPAAAALTIQSGNNQAGQFGTALAQPIVVMIADQFGNVISGAQVTFAASSGGGSVNPTSATTSATGLASTQWTLGASGTQSLQVTSAGVAGSPATVNASVGAGAIATTTVAPRLDTLTSFTDTRQVSATGRDAAGTIVNGTWTWVSRTPAVATVNGSGLVTSVANGSTFIVATEAGGSKDSAQIVVQQRIASVNVNPASRSIYTSGTFGFTAQAVDGRGVPMSSQPTFAWSSSQPTVASVNATTGFVTGLSIGSSQIRATSGATVGVSNLAVLSPITRIDVSFDSTGAPAPDNFTMTSLGNRRMYRALARDTLLAPMTGVTFTWSSTNASVAVIDSTTPTQSRATAAANGITTIQASAQGVSGGATLNVAQVLASIELTPATATVAAGGTTPMLARGKDANGRYISGGSFTYTSITPSIATVNASSGVVTGVANGTTNITATSGSITSNAAIINVNNTGPSIISFGRDTIGVGRGSSLSVPILLSKPSASAITVNLAVADTFAFWSAASVTINAGQTSVNATLNGRNAGTTRITALDGGTSGYFGDTAVVAVQANLRMTSSGYSLTATDQLSTQVLLSDPSPAGGTYVTFAYGTAGRAQVSPDPAFIPAGQLAADVVIRGLVAGTTTLTPSATGVTGAAASVNVSASNLSFGQTTIRLGQGQFQPNTYVQVPNTLFAPLTVTLTSSDTSIVTVPPTVTISSPNYVYFNTSARGLGTAKIIATAAGWRPDTFTVVSTTPKARICCNNNVNVTSPQQSLSVYAADSVSSIHNRTSSLAVRMTSSDSTVMRVIDTLVTIPAGSSSNNTGARVIPGGAGGTAWIRTSAGGHSPDSVLFTVVGPKLNFSYTSSRIGSGQQDDFSHYVQIPNAVTSAVTITLTSSDSSILAVPTTVTIPANQNYQYFLMRGKATGSATLIATSAGYAPDTATTVVTTPRVDLTGSGTINAFSSTTTSVYTRDSTFTAHNRTAPLTVRLVSTDTTVLTVDSLLTIPAGQYYPNTSANIVAVGPGTARIIATAPGHFPDTAAYTVIAPKLSMSWRNSRIGARQKDIQVYVQTPTTRAVAVPVTLAQKQPSRVLLSTTSPTIAANINYQYFDYSGLTPGRDTIIASAPGYVPDTAFITVTTPQLNATGLPGTTTTTSPPSVVYVYSTDTLNGAHISNDTIVVRAVSSDSNVIRPAQRFFRILKGDYYGQTSVTYVGAGTARIVYSDSAGSGYRPDSTNLVTVTGPSLSICCGSGRLGMRQHTSVGQFYVTTPNNVTTPLVVNLLSTDPRVATVPATVTIPVNQNYAYFTITGLDTLGTIQIQATATGYALGTSTMQVTAPKFIVSTQTQLRTTSGKTPITVYAADANNTQHETNENVVVSLATSAPGVAAIDSASVTILANSSSNGSATWTPGAVGTAVISAADNRTVPYKYTTGTQTVNVVTPQASLSFTTLRLGIGQYADEYAQLPDATSVARTVSITHAAVPRTTTPGSVTIPANTNFEYLRITATTAGSDTITIAAPGHSPDKGVVVVGQGRIDPVSNWPTSLRVGDSVQVTMYTRDMNQGVRNVAAATTFALSSNANISFVSGGAQITSAVVAANGQSVNFYVKGVSAGTGSGTITNANYQSYSNSITVNP